MKYIDDCGQIHRKRYGKSDKANASENRNSDFQGGYAWGVETYACDARKVILAEAGFREKFDLTRAGFEEWKRGLWAARAQMAAAGVKRPKK
jgi:hypothetical protein